MPSSDFRHLRWKSSHAILLCFACMGVGTNTRSSSRCSGLLSLSSPSFAFLSTGTGPPSSASLSPLSPPCFSCSLLFSSKLSPFASSPPSSASIGTGHAHVAEALAVPLHIFFTMPWTPTYEFPHPLAHVPQSAGYWLSYIVVDLLIWWGIRRYINDFRKRNLKLAPIAYFSLYRGSVSHLPTAYMWSHHVMPKPSVPEVSDSVFPLEDCPHDWLFPQCLAVLHHGSAGTTATGLRAGVDSFFFVGICMWREWRRVP